MIWISGKLPPMFHVLADLGLERTEFADRGAVVLAIIAWVLAAIAMIRVFGGGLPDRPGSDPRAREIDRIRQWTRSYPKELVKGIAQLGLGAGVMLALLVVTRLSGEEVVLPDGWMRIRPPGESSAIAVQGDLVWVGGRGGVTMINRLDGQRLETELEGPRIRGVRDILVEGEVVWIAHYRGVSRFETGRKRTDLTHRDGLPAGPALSLCRDRDGRLWVGTRDGAACLDGDTCRVITPEDGLAASQVDVLFEDASGHLWFGSASPRRGGLSRFDGESWTTWSPADGLAHASIASIGQSADGTIWVGCGFGRMGGASRLEGDRWVSIGRKDGLAGEKVRSVFQDRKGRLWLGSEYDGITVVEGENKTVLTPEHGLVGWEVKEMVQDQDGVYWLATEDGVSRIVDPDPVLDALEAQRSQ